MTKKHNAYVGGSARNALSLSRTLILVAVGLVVLIWLGNGAWPLRMAGSRRSHDVLPKVPDSAEKAAPLLARLLEKKWMNQEGDGTDVYTQMFLVYESNKIAGVTPACDSQFMDLLVQAARMKDCDVKQINVVWDGVTENIAGEQPTLSRDFATATQGHMGQPGAVLDPHIYEALAVLGWRLMTWDSPGDDGDLWSGHEERTLVFTRGFAWTIRGIDGLSKAYEASGQTEKVKELAPCLNELQRIWKSRER